MLARPIEPADTPAVARSASTRPAAWRCHSCAGRSLGVCAPLDDDALGPLAAMAGRRRWDRRQVLYCAGDRAEAFYKITSGVVAEFMDLADGRRQIVAIHTVGDLCGYSTRSRRHVFTAQAIAPAEACAFGSEKFSAYMRGNVQFACVVAGDVRERLNQATIGRTVVGQLRSFERVAHFILEIEERMGPNGVDTGHVELHLTRQEIADYLGLTEETVSRAFSKLKQMRLIELGGANVVAVLDRQRLAELARVGGRAASPPAIAQPSRED